MNPGLILIDQTPLFTEAMDSCQRACSRIELLKQELVRYETRDVSAYERWFNSTFGAHLTGIRELASTLRQRQSDLERARRDHWSRFFGASRVVHSEPGFGRSESASGLEAQWETYEDEDLAAHETSEETRRASARGFSTFDPSEAEEGEYGPEHEDHRYEAGSFYDDEQDWYYSEDEEAARRFEKLFVNGFAGRRSGGYRSRGWADDDPREQARARAQGRGARSGDTTFSAEEGVCSSSGSEALRSRVKDRYRMLVRKLHPDLNPSLSPEAKSLWNQVQAAYLKQDLDQLDVLVAVSAAFSGSITGFSSLHDMRRATAEIEKLISPLERRIESARKNRSWAFSVLRDREPLMRAVERELRISLSKLKQELEQVEAQIARFTKPKRAPSEDAARAEREPAVSPGR